MRFRRLRIIPQTLLLSGPVLSREKVPLAPRMLNPSIDSELQKRVGTTAVRGILTGGVINLYRGVLRNISSFCHATRTRY